MTSIGAHFVTGTSQRTMQRTGIPAVIYLQADFSWALERSWSVIHSNLQNAVIILNSKMLRRIRPISAFFFLFKRLFLFKVLKFFFFLFLNSQCQAQCFPQKCQQLSNSFSKNPMYASNYWCNRKNYIPYSSHKKTPFHVHISSALYGFQNTVRLTVVWLAS